mmetsp:Transcript_9053/g.34149  ORF Transcript_9053/g.34149 Transcript_9053/m.34149 type:complete len:306 (+) Transcript_9053:90-1007(+)
MGSEEPSRQRRPLRPLVVRGGVGFGGWTLAAIHLLLISLKVIDPMGPLATGTLTVHTWFLGWMLALYWKGGNDAVVRIEAAVLLSALFQLGLGALAFSRLYYGWIAGHKKDLFHSLSLVYLREDPMLPAFVVDWWEQSATSRFTGIGWYICEACDILAHQVPFFFMYRITKNTGVWDYVLDHVWTIWPLVALAGPLHRMCWDLSTCGHLWCDGPYRGFLSKIAPLEQFLWHFIPCVLLCMYFAEAPLLSRQLYNLEQDATHMIQSKKELIEKSLQSFEKDAVKIYHQAKRAAEAAHVEVEGDRPC